MKVVTMADNRPLRILCLHGYRQTSVTFREKTGSFRKALKKKAEFEYITAPLVVPLNEGESESGCSWWFTREEDSFSSRDKSAITKGYDDSLAVIAKAVEENGPFDGLMGFSQGGAMAGLLCGMMQQNLVKYPFKFAILISAFKSLADPHQKYYAEKIAIPTLHVFGKTDQVIPKEMSEEFLQYFNSPTTYIHAGGHFVPATGEAKRAYIDFLDRFKD